VCPRKQGEWERARPPRLWQRGDIALGIGSCRCEKVMIHAANRFESKIPISIESPKR